jgi:uncharacterized protein
MLWDNFMIYARRALEKRLFDAFTGPFITALVGPRRVGKSTLIDHFIQLSQGATTVCLNMDRMEEREKIKAGELEAIILTTIKRPLKPGQRVWVTIDEVQKCPEIFEQIKTLYDAYKDQDAIKFILTGSALLEIHRLSAESLAGRIKLYQLAAFGLAEATDVLHQTGLKHSVFDLITSPDDNEKWQQYFNQLLPFSSALKQTLRVLQIWGGLPEVLTLSNNEDRLDYLANYLQTYLEKDVRAINTITDLTLYRNLMDISAEQTGSVRDDRRITQALSCHRETLKKYRGYLQATLMYQDIYPYINTTMKRLVKSPKGYLVNNGLLSYLSGLNNIELLSKTGQIGHRLENWFLNELTIWLNRSPEKHSIHYWRTSGGAEVDFVVKKPPYIYPFEVNNATQIDRKKVKNLMRFKAYEPTVDFVYYIYGGKFKLDLENRIVFLPAWAVI